MAFKGFRGAKKGVLEGFLWCFFEKKRVFRVVFWGCFFEKKRVLGWFLRVFFREKTGFKGFLGVFWPLGGRFWLKKGVFWGVLGGFEEKPGFGSGSFFQGGVGGLHCWSYRDWGGRFTVFILKNGFFGVFVRLGPPRRGFLEKTGRKKGVFGVVFWGCFFEEKTGFRVVFEGVFSRKKRILDWFLRVFFREKTGFMVVFEGLFSLKLGFRRGFFNGFFRKNWCFGGGLGGRKHRGWSIFYAFSSCSTCFRPWNIGFFV